MNVTGQLSFMRDDDKVLGAGDYALDNDEAGSFCYSGIWRDGKVVALVVDDMCDSNVVMERGNHIVKAVNAHDKLVAALKLARVALLHSTPDLSHYPDPVKRHADAEAAVKAALAAAGEPV